MEKSNDLSTISFILGCGLIFNCSDNVQTGKLVEVQKEILKENIDQNKELNTTLKEIAANLKDIQQGEAVDRAIHSIESYKDESAEFCDGLDQGPNWKKQWATHLLQVGTVVPDGCQVTIPWACTEDGKLSEYAVLKINCQSRDLSR